MSASFQEVLGALGDATVDFRWDPAVDAGLIEGHHLLFYWGEELLWAAVITRKGWPAGMTRVRGRSLEWWLGLDKDGPVIEDREYLSGRNKLSNPGFELLDAISEPLYWSTSQDSTWQRVTSGQQSGSAATHVAGDLGKDDALVSEEKFEAKAGDIFDARAALKRAAATKGKGRVRVVFGGRFDPPNLMPALNSGGWTDVSQFLTDADIPTGAYIRLGPVTRPQVVSNPSFELGLTGWIITSGGGIAVVAGGFDGSYALSIQDWSGGTVALLNDADPSSPAILNTYPVNPGERWLYEVMGYAAPGTDGHYDVRVFPNFGAPLSVAEGEGASLASLGWKYFQVESDIGDSGGGTLLVSINTWGQSAGQYKFDRVLATRIRGNRAVMRSDPFTVTPEKAHHLIAPIELSAVTGHDGTVGFVITLSGTGRPDVVLNSPTVDASHAPTLVSFDFTPPSGYDLAVIDVVAIDINGEVRVGQPDMRLQDTSTSIVDVAAPLHTSGAYVTEGGTATAPAGTESVYLAVIAEAGGTDWYADDASLVRVGTAATAAQLVADVLVHPKTGQPIATPGSIIGPDAIPFDRHVRNMTNRELLVQFSRADMVPPREWRLGPDNVLDWDLAENLYETRDMLLGPEELIVVGDPDTERSAERQLTDVKVMGADRQRPNGEHGQITGSATRSPGGMVDWFGHPLSRMRVVEDSTVDHVAYADAYAEYTADQNGLRENLRYRLADWRAAGRFDVGDWLYAWKPEAGLIDLANERHAPSGEVVYPAKKRVLSRTWRLGAGTFRVTLRKPDGTELDLTDFVEWERSTTADVELGDNVPEFVGDPQGPARGNQFLRFRASAAR